MSADDRLDDVAGAILDGSHVDWHLVETRSAGTGEDVSVRGLKAIEQIAIFNRALQRQSGPAVASPEHWGHLVLLERASSGRSGEIWRAWDPWLQREVALKFLLTIGDTAIDDRALLAEARALARVRHPGVVAVYGLAEHAGRIGMWMELLAGDTLDVEIARRGALPASEVARIGLELSRALEAIAAAGLVHRDIKPANIILESSGRIVLTDFGLGRRMALSEQEPWRSSGTPMFMSPERLLGEPSTPRSDLYALGVTLRWALTGRCPFHARTIEELKRETERGPSEPLIADRLNAPDVLIEAIDAAMAARVDERHADAGKLTEQLTQALDEIQAKAKVRVQRSRIAFAALGIILAVAAGFLISNLADRSTSSHLARFTLSAPPGTVISPATATPVISPDGRYVVIMAGDSAGVGHLWLRPLDSLNAQLLEGTDDADGPFWSPDGGQIAFFANSKLKKISISGGPPEVICPAQDARGGTWGKNNVIVFAPTIAGPLCRVSAEGGTVTEIQRPDSARHETALRWPHFLPDGKHFFFVTLPPREAGFDVFVASVDSKDRRRVMSAGSGPICAGKKGIIVANDGRLMYQRFDYRRLRPTGPPVNLGIAPFSDVSVGEPLASASKNGVLIHMNEDVTNTRLYWLDRSGQRVGRLPVPEGRYERVFIAPDGKRILAERRDSPTSIALWLIDAEHGEARRFSQGSQTRIGGAPVWSPDGRRIAFNSNRSGRTYIYQRLVDEAGEEQLLYQSQGQFNEVIAWSPDGRYLISEQTGLGTGWDMWLISMEGKHEAIPYLRTRFNELAPAISPDGRYLAYGTDAGGKGEVYVRTFPKPGAEHLVVSMRGFPAWCGNNEILLMDPRGVWSVPVSTTPTFRAGKPRFLFRSNPGGIWTIPTPSGDRFLQIVPEENEALTVTVHLGFLNQIDR